MSTSTDPTTSPKSPLAPNGATSNKENNPVDSLTSKLQKATVNLNGATQETPADTEEKEPNAGVKI